VLGAEVLRAATLDHGNVLITTLHDLGLPFNVAAMAILGTGCRLLHDWVHLGDGLVDLGDPG
jgi:hypothetical protein